MLHLKETLLIINYWGRFSLLLSLGIFPALPKSTSQQFPLIPLKCVCFFYQSLGFFLSFIPSFFINILSFINCSLGVESEFTIGCWCYWNKVVIFSLFHVLLMIFVLAANCLHVMLLPFFSARPSDYRTGLLTFLISMHFLDQWLRRLWRHLCIIAGQLSFAATKWQLPYLSWNLSAFELMENMLIKIKVLERAPKYKHLHLLKKGVSWIHPPCVTSKQK